MLNLSGKFNEITVAADSGVSETELRDRIRRGAARQTPRPSPAARSADEQASDVKKGLGFFNTFLLVFALIALFVGAFIIFNTFSMLVAQRTRELALLRALGASRGQVRRAVLLEAVVVGLLGSVIGLAPASAWRSGSRRCSASFGAAAARRRRRSSRPAPSSLSFAVGILVTAAAAFMPARRASRVAAAGGPARRRDRPTGR